MCKCVRTFVSACMCAYVCARGVQIQMGKGNVRAKGRPGKYYSPGRDGEGDGRVRGTEREERQKERDPRRDVTLPNHKDRGKARSDSQGSSDSSKLYLCCSHQPI